MMVSGEPDKFPLVTSNSCVPARSPSTQEPRAAVPLPFVTRVCVVFIEVDPFKIKAFSKSKGLGLLFARTLFHVEL